MAARDQHWCVKNVATGEEVVVQAEHAFPAFTLAAPQIGHPPFSGVLCMKVDPPPKRGTTRKKASRGKKRQ